MFMPREFRIPVKRLKRPKRDNPITGTKLAGRVRYYEVDGKLNHTYQKSEWDTKPMYFIQAVDGEMHLITKPANPNETLIETLTPYIKDAKKWDLIRFDLPKNQPEIYSSCSSDAGVKYILGVNHPNQCVRLLVLNSQHQLAHMVHKFECDPPPENPLTA